MVHLIYDIGLIVLRLISRLARRDYLEGSSR